MQALILAASFSEQFGGSLPKPLVRIAGKPIILQLIEQLHLVGCDDVVVVTGSQRLLIERALSPSVRIAFNPFFQVSDTLTSFWFAQSQLLDDFIIVQADLVIQPEILHTIATDPADLVFAYDASFINDDEFRIELVDGIVRNLNRAIPPVRAAGVVLPIHKLSRKALSRLKVIADQAMQTAEFQRELESALLEMIMAGTFSISARDVNGFKWCEIKFSEDLDRARLMFGE